MNTNSPCYKLGRHVNSDPVPLDNLRLETSTNCFYGLSYHHIELVKFESSQDFDIITISFLNRTVRIKGKTCATWVLPCKCGAWNPSSRWPSVIHRWPLVKMVGSNPSRYLNKRKTLMLKANGQLSKSERARDSASAETKIHVEKKGYKRAEAATYLGVAKITIDRLTKRGLLHPSRALRHPIYSRDDLDRFLRETSEPIE